MSQAVTWSAGTYRLSFAAARCGNFAWPQHAPPLEVRIDGQPVGTFTPAGTAYESFTTEAFDVAAGTHTVAIRSLVPDSDYAALVDDVRIARVGAAPVTTWTVYDGVNPYADFDDAGDLQTRYLHGPAVDLLLGRTDATGATAWYLTDRLGSVRDLADATGTVIDHVAYDAYGQITGETNPAAGDRHKYAGLEHAAVLDLDLADGRPYDAALGRWTQPDPIGFLGGDPNLNRYVGNAPTNYVDPRGLYGEEAAFRGGAALAQSLFGTSDPEPPDFRAARQEAEGQAALVGLAITAGGGAIAYFGPEAVFSFLVGEAGEAAVEEVTGIPVIIGPEDIIEAGARRGARELAEQGAEAATAARRTSDCPTPAPRAVPKSPGDLFEASVKNTFRKKIIRQNEVLRDAGGRVIGEIDFETAESLSKWVSASVEKSTSCTNWLRLRLNERSASM